MNEDEATPNQVEIVEVGQLVDRLNLVDVKFYELWATRSESADEDVEEELVPQHALKIGFGDHGIEIRLRIELTTKFGEVRADAGIVYQSIPEDASLNIPGSIALEFANRVAIMAVLPFLREAISTITQRVFDHAILMPIVRAGELEFLPESYSNADPEEPAGASFI